MGRELKFILGMFIFLLAIIGFVHADNIACYSNSDCVSGYLGNEFCQDNDVYKNFLNSSCINPGTNTSYCSNNTLPVFLIDCGINEYSNWSIDYCMNNSIYHSRTEAQRGCRIINPTANISGCYYEFVFAEVLVQTCNSGCSEGICNNASITCNNNSDCGCNGFFGNTTCQNNNVFQNYVVYTCNNPGTTNSSCSNTINSQLNQNCGNNSCGSYGTNYCKSNNVYHNRTCNDRGCSSGECFNNINIEEDLIETCHHGCENGMCSHMPNMTCMNNSECNDNNNFTEDLCIKPGTMNSSCVHNPIRCFNDLQCGKDGFTINKYCKNHDVYSDYNKYKCLDPATSNSGCLVNTTSRLYEKCNYKCLDDECHQRNPLNYPDYEFNDSDAVSQTRFSGYDVYIKNQTFDAVKISSIIPLQSDNSITQLLSRNLWVILMIFIIFLIILIIVLTLMR